MNPLRVLLVAPDSERRTDLAALLRQAQHQVDAFSDAASAADSIREPGFDALVVDLSTPDLDLTTLRKAMSPADPVEPESLEVAERRHLAQVLRFTSGNKRRAALLLGISRSTLLNKVRKYGLITLAGVLLFSGSSLNAQTVAPISQGRVISGTLSFDGHATVGDFVGKTTSVTGEMSGGPDLSRVRGWVQAPVKTLVTGNGRRDRDLNKSMESDKHPDLRFELTNVVPRGGTPDSTALTLHGKLMLHGVTRTVALPGWIQLSAGKARVRSDFPLSLKEYEIKGLSKMLGVLKMYDNIEVHADLIFGPVGSESSATRPRHDYGVIRTRPSREITTVRVAEPLLR
jgi:polyisoprenoid-binding protein YceI/CheY-like chemotaxis protein